MSVDVALSQTQAVAPVPVVDLRQEYDTLVAHSAFTDYVRQRADVLVPHLQADEGVDIGQVILIDDAAAVLRHSDAYTMVLHSPAVSQVICVAIGMADDDERVAVLLPNILRSELVAMLWVGDPAGVLWQPGHGRAPVVQRTPAGDDGDPRPLRDLIEALTAREVFRRVVTQVASMTASAAVPGVRLRSGRLDDDALAAAECRALGHLSAGGAAPSPADGAPPGPDVEAEVAALAKHFVPPRRIVPGGRLAAARQRAESLVDRIDATVEAASPLWGLFVPGRGARVPRLSAEAVEAVDEYQRVLCELFQTMDSQTDEQRRALLRAEGIELPPPSNRSPVVDRLRDTVERASAARQPLSRTVEQLYGGAATLLPMGSAVRIPAARKAAEDTAATPEMPDGFGGPWTMIFTFLAPLLSAMWLPASRFSGVAAVLLLVAGAFGVRVRRRRLGVDLARPVRDLAAVAVVLLVSCVGPAMVFAQDATGVVPLPEAVQDVPPSVGVSGVLVGLLMALTTPATWWHLLMSAWRTKLTSTDTLRPAIAELNRLYDETTTEWVGADARRRTSDTVRAVAASLAAIEATFTARARHLRERLGTVSTGQHPTGQHPTERHPTGAGLAALAMREDLHGLVLLCMADRWAEARDGDLRGMRERAADRSASLLEEYENHARRWGVQEPPPGWPRRQDAERVTWWQDDGPLRRALSTRELVQLLCSEEQVGMLSRDVGGDVTTRFAPRTARETLAEPSSDRGPDADGLGDLVWTTTGPGAGVLHLVPLKAGVREVQIEARAKDIDARRGPGDGRARREDAW